MDNAETTTTVDQPVPPAGEEAGVEGLSAIAEVAPPMAGRYIAHPPEPPHLLEIWYSREQQALIADYQAAHPDAPAPAAVEHWVRYEDGQWVPVEGERPTIPQVLHAGTLKEELPLIGYAPWENHVYFGIALLFVLGVFFVATRSFRRDRTAAMRRPGRGQIFIETVVSAMDNFCQGVLGPKNGRRYLPYIGTLFIVILVSNIMGMIPLMRAPTSSIVITFSLAVCTFFVVQATAWIRLGPLTYLHHLMGSPRDLIGWCLSPLFLLLEIISDFIAKPLSLSLRLFGNIFGKDILLGAFLGMSITLMAVLAGPVANVVGIPLTIPFYFLGLLLSTIQALVFALLSTIYVALVLPHDDEHHAEEPDETETGAAGLADVEEPVPVR